MAACRAERIERAFRALAVAGLAVGMAGPGFAEPAARPGPFGITIGGPLSEVGKVDPLGGGGYLVLQPPVPNSSIEGVAVVSFADTGICNIVAKTPRFEDDASGARVRLALDNLAKQLSVKYGPYTKKIVKCTVGDGCESNWLSHVQANQAEYAYAWNLADQKRDDGVAIIIAKAGAVDATTSQARVQYYGAQEQACENEENAAAGQGL